MKLNQFLAQHVVFTVDELGRFLAKNGTGNSNTRKALLAYHCKQGRILRIRRGLYATIPFGADPESYPVDPYLVTTKMTPDAVLAYHSALEFHGKAHSVYTRVYYTTKKHSLPLAFRSVEIRGVSIPQSLREKGQAMFGVTSHDHAGIEIRVTNLERTFVDVLDRPNLGGSWEEIWRSIESIEFFDLDQVIAYVKLLENATTAAKVGFFLEQHREALMVENYHLEELHALRPQKPHYLLRNKRKEARWVKHWNLMVPNEILNRTWEEVL